VTSANLQVWFYVELTLKAKADGTSKTVYLSNRAILNDTNKGRYIPILKSIQGVGTVAGKYIPDEQRGIVTFDNTPGSYGYQRRFSDLFERYTAVIQTIKIYSATTALDDLDVSSDFSLQWQGLVSRYSFDAENVTLEIASDVIPRRVITKVVSASAFPNAPTKSLGKHLPIVLGMNVYCEAIQIAPDGDSSPEYAYATTLATDCPVHGVSGYYAKDKDGVYQQVFGATSVNTVLYGNASVAGKSHTIWGTEESAKPFQATTPYILTNAYLRIYKDAGTDTDGVITCRIREAIAASYYSPAIIPGDVLASGTFDTSSIPTTAAEYDLSFGLDKSLVLKENEYYFVTFQYTSTANKVEIYFDSAVDEDAYVLSGIWYKAQSGAIVAKKWFYGVLGVVFADTRDSTGDSDGLGYAHIELTQSYSPSSVPDLTKLSLFLTVNGLADPANTSSLNAVTGPAYAIRMLDKEWSGSTWVASKLDFSRHSDSRTYVSQGGTAFDRSISGKTEGQTFLADIYQAICRQHGMRLYMFNGGATPLALYAWGTNRTTAAVIGDDDAAIERVDQLGVETVINRVLMYYDKRVINADPTSAAAQAGFQNYAGVIDWVYSTDTYTALISTLSEAIYGLRELADREFPLIGDYQTATEMAKYLISIFREPQVYVTFRVPFFKYNARDLFDVVELLHPDLPSHFGTTADANLATYGGADTDLLQGHHWKRAKRYRIQIESKEMLWDGGQYPQLRFMGRLIPPTGIDPT
jgi:hypothetical protein